MNRKLVLISLLLSFSPFLISCNETRGVDTSKLESQTTGAIIKRSGTAFSSHTPEGKALALADAQNRLRAGGGLLGNDKGFSLGNDDPKKTTTATIIVFL